MNEELNNLKKLLKEVSGKDKKVEVKGTLTKETIESLIELGFTVKPYYTFVNQCVVIEW